MNTKWIPNISAEIMNYATEKGLDAIGTGGGCDYIHCKNEFGNCIVIFGMDDPTDIDSLMDPCQVVTFKNDNDWEIVFNERIFDTVKEAIDCMSKIARNT